LKTQLGGRGRTGGGGGAKSQKTNIPKLLPDGRRTLINCRV